MRILLVEDEPQQREMVATLINTQCHFPCDAVASAEQAMEQLKSSQYDLIVSDWQLPGIDGLGLLDHIKTDYPDCSFLLMTAYGSVSHAVSSIRSGADDYLAKPFESKQLKFAIDKIANTRSLKTENSKLKQQSSERDRLGNIIGSSIEMQKIYQRIEKVSDTNISVLIHGESGTGKELVAQALHQYSSRKDSMFLPVNCSAIPESIAEAELFGAEKGAYTGAHQTKPGKFEAANGGTLFLDEIAELSLAIQAKLLRVLQEGKVTRVGGNKEITVDVRVVSASHKHLADEVAAGRFREDLYYRLNVIPIELPALRDRTPDLSQLIEFFNSQFSTKHGLEPLVFSQSAMAALFEYVWPGNIRELSNLIERLLVLNDGSPVEINDLPFKLTAEPKIQGFELPAEGIKWDEFERSVLLQALKQTDNNRSKAAQLLGLGYKAFLYRLEKHQIQIPK